MKRSPYFVSSEVVILNNQVIKVDWLLVVKPEFFLFVKTVQTSSGVTYPILIPNVLALTDVSE